MLLIKIIIRYQLGFSPTSLNYTGDRELYGKDLWINALQAENTFGTVKVDASLSHSATEEYTIFGHQANPWTTFTFTGSGPFGYDASGKPIDYSSASAQEGMSLIKALGVFNNLGAGDPDTAYTGGNWPSEHYNQFYQHLYNASLDVTAPVNFSNDITASFKAGGKYIRTTRENNVTVDFAHGTNDTYASPEADDYFVKLTGQGQPLSAANPLSFTQVMDPNFARGKNYLSDFYNFTNGGFKYVIDPNLYDPWLKLSEAGWAVPLEKGDSYKDDFEGAEQFSAGYAMATINIGPQATLLGGVRFESYNMDYHAQFTYVTHTVYGDCVTTENGSIAVNDSTNPANPLNTVPYNYFNVDRTDNNFFPDVQFQYKVNDWSDLRLAYTTGISRPDYTAIIPKVAFYAGNFELGNPLLKPSTAQNFDVVGSFHSNSIGLFTVDAFYKEIANQMYSTSIDYDNVSYYAGDVLSPTRYFCCNILVLQQPPHILLPSI